MRSPNSCGSTGEVAGCTRMCHVLEKVCDGCDTHSQVEPNGSILSPLTIVYMPVYTGFTIDDLTRLVACLDYLG